MLIEFQVANFRSIGERQTFSMVADPVRQHIETNTFVPELSSFPRLLRSGVVFGANAAGKTNLLRAMQYVKNFVVSSAARPASTPHEYKPFVFSREYRDAPSSFRVTFAQEGKWYEYEFSLNEQRILTERLIEHEHARGRELFNRTYNSKRKKYDWNYSTYFKGQKSSWSEQTRENALFLSTAAQLNSAQLLPVYRWFQKTLVVIVGPVRLNQTLTIKKLQEPDGKAAILPLLREADFGISDISVQRQSIPTDGAVVGGRSVMVHQEDGGAPEIIKVSFAHTWGNDDDLVLLDLEDESSGTQAFFRNAGAWLNVLQNGEVFLIDEIDTSLHPLLVRFLIEKFHSNETNPNNAQLIFNTHDITLLDLSLFRRDQIWFIEKGADGMSSLYPLSDFKPRDNEALQNWYLRGRYGALPILSEDR